MAAALAMDVCDNVEDGWWFFASAPANLPLGAETSLHAPEVV